MASALSAVRGAKYSVCHRLLPPFRGVASGLIRPAFPMPRGMNRE